jgi:hypothetical protein
MVDSELWTKLAMSKVAADPDSRFVITDVRFENEAKMIRETGGLVVHLRGRKHEGTLQHASEQPLAFFPGDVTVWNDAQGIDALHDKLGAVLGEYL